MKEETEVFLNVDEKPKHNKGRNFKHFLFLSWIIFVHISLSILLGVLFIIEPEPDLPEFSMRTEQMIEVGDEFLSVPKAYLTLEPNPTFAKGTKEKYRKETKRKDRAYIVVQSRCYLAQDGILKVLDIEEDRDNFVGNLNVTFEYMHHLNPHPADGYCPSGLIDTLSFNNFLDIILKK